MQSTTDSLAARVLRWLSNAVYRYPRLFFYPQLLLFIASIIITAVKPQIQFDISRDNLVGSEKQYHKHFLRYQKEFLAQHQLVAVVESEDMEKNRQFVERLGDRLVQETNVFTDVLYNNDVTMLGRKALLFFPESDLKELLQTLRDYRPFIQQFVQATNLNSLFRLVNQQFRTAKREENAENESLVKALPALERILSQASDRPIKATICLIVGLAYTMAFATLVIGHLNILTITFVPMLIGLAIDFGVHLISRYEEELRQGKSEQIALEKAMVYTGQGIFTGCFTTAGAFLAMALTDFKGIQEMGIISGGGLLICLFPMITLLPVLLLRGRQNVLDHTFPQEIEKRARFERLWLERPLLVTGITVGLCWVSLVKAIRVPFDYNLLHMQSKDLPAVVFEQKLIDSAKQSVLYCAVIARSLPEALELEAKITNLTAVASVDSMARYLSEDQMRKLEIVGDIKKELAPIRFPEVDDHPADVPELSATLWYLQGYVGFATTDIE